MRKAAAVALDPQVQTLIEQLRSLGQPPLRELGVEGARGALLMLGQLGARPETVVVEELAVPGPAGDRPARSYRPAAAGDRRLPGLLYLHGGGFVIGGLDSHDLPCAWLAERAGCAVVSLDYRLAPEHRFPAAIEDAAAALGWLADHGATVGIDTARLAVGGDSAGGNLAAVVARRSRDGLAPPLVAHLAVYPWVDLDCHRPSVTANGTGYLLEAADLEWFREQYAPDTTDWSHPDLSPLAAPDLSGLPPAVVATAELDPLRDQGDEYARRLQEAGVPVRHLRAPGLVHGFLHLPPVSEACARAADAVAAELASLLG